MKGAAHRRGQPLVALIALLGGWIGVRAALLESPPAPTVLAEAPARMVPVTMARPPIAEVGLHPRRAEAPSSAALPPPRLAPVPVRAPLAPLADAAAGPRVAGGHQMLWLAGLALLPLPAEAALARPVVVGGPFPPLLPAGPRRLREPAPRWSADGWLLWRGQDGALALGGTYGGGQAGAVVRYHLAPASARRPALYLRASSPLRIPHGAELAAGLALRPLARVPVVAAAELRAVQTSSGRAVLRPAAMLVSEFPPLAAPLGLRAEVYGATGYVGGRDATAFVDGQVRADRRVMRLGPADLRAGGGLWGGAQRGAARLDLGPSATLAVPLGAGGARVSADWRFRVIGDAAPASGPAVTLSAGF